MFPLYHNFPNQGVQKCNLQLGTAEDPQKAKLDNNQEDTVLASARKSYKHG